MRGGERRNQRNCIFGSGKETTVNFGNEGGNGGMHDYNRRIMTDNGKRLSADRHEPQLEPIKSDKPTS